MSSIGRPVPPKGNSITLHFGGEPRVVTDTEISALLVADQAKPPVQRLPVRARRDLMALRRELTEKGAGAMAPSSPPALVQLILLAETGQSPRPKPAVARIINAQLDAFQHIGRVKGNIEFCSKDVGVFFEPSFIEGIATEVEPILRGMGLDRVRTKRFVYQCAAHLLAFRFKEIKSLIVGKKDREKLFHKLWEEIDDYTYADDLGLQNLPRHLRSRFSDRRDVSLDELGDFVSYLFPGGSVVWEGPAVPGGSTGLKR